MLLDDSGWSIQATFGGSGFSKTSAALDDIEWSNRDLSETNCDNRKLSVSMRPERRTQGDDSGSSDEHTG